MLAWAPASFPGPTNRSHGSPTARVRRKDGETESGEMQGAAPAPSSRAHRLQVSPSPPAASAAGYRRRAATSLYLRDWPWKRAYGSTVVYMSTTASPCACACACDTATGQLSSAAVRRDASSSRPQGSLSTRRASVPGNNDATRWSGRGGWGST
jgi:hypothetical protein